jgi:glucodextranase-like protein
MRKEILIAIFLGITFGGIITYGIYIANDSISNKVQGLNPKTTTIPIPSATPEPKISLTINSPESDIVTDQATIPIEGNTNSEAIVAIITDNNEYLVEADTNGFFSQKISLVKGVNSIKVNASDTNQLSETQIINLVYTTELDLTPDETEEESEV